MDDKYQHFFNYVELIFDSKFSIDYKSFQGIEISKKEFIELYNPKLLYSYRLLEDIASFLMHENGYIEINEKYKITNINPSGKKIFDSQLFKGESDDYIHVSPINLFVRCGEFIVPEQEICYYFNALRIIRNQIAHQAFDDDKGVLLINKFFDSFYILLLWLINNRYRHIIDEDIYSRLSRKIHKEKFKLEVMVSRIFEGKNDKNPSESEYITYLEKKVCELEDKAENAALLMNNMRYLVDALGSIKQDVSIIKEGQESIIKKLDNLLSIITNYQEEIKDRLDNASKENNEELMERIINEYSIRVINELDKRMKKNNSYYEEERKALINIFGEKLWNKLQDNSKNFLITGKVLYKELSYSQKVDYSGVCLLITKAVENELHYYFYHLFRIYLEDKYPYPECKDKWPSFFKKIDYRGESIIHKSEFTLGSIKYFLCQNASYNEGDKAILLEYASNLFKEQKEKENNLKFISSSAEKIRVDYRNPSAHVNVINSVKASECLAYVIDISKILIRYMDMFN